MPDQFLIIDFDDQMLMAAANLSDKPLERGKWCVDTGALETYLYGRLKKTAIKTIEKRHFLNQLLPSRNIGRIINQELADKAAYFARFQQTPDKNGTNLTGATRCICGLWFSRARTIVRC